MEIIWELDEVWEEINWVGERVAIYRKRKRHVEMFRQTCKWNVMYSPVEFWHEWRIERKRDQYYYIFFFHVLHLLPSIFFLSFHFPKQYTSRRTFFRQLNNQILRPPYDFLCEMSPLQFSLHLQIDLNFNDFPFLAHYTLTFFPSDVPTGRPPRKHIPGMNKRSSVKNRY